MNTSDKLAHDIVVAVASALAAKLDPKRAEEAIPLADFLATLHQKLQVHYQGLIRESTP